MSKGIPKASYLILIISAIMILAGCGGGGGGGGSSSSSGTGTGTGTGLSVVDEVSVVEAQEGAGKITAMKLGKVFLSPSDIPADSDYNNDKQEVYVHERSAEAFNTINEILCAMGQSRYAEMVNMGDYKAQIDLNQCESTKDDASSAGASSQDQSSGSTAPDYEMWTVNSSRADNSSPHIVKVWINQKAEHDMPASLLFVKVTITEGTSDTNPYGLFTINFKGHPVIDGVVNTELVLFKGYLKTEINDEGKVLLSFVEEEGEDEDGNPFGRQVVLNREADGSGGSGSVYSNNEWEGETSFNIAFDTTHFLREDAVSTDQMCFSRSSFDETVWDYGLYDSNGARVNRNSGFSIKKDDAYGWIGYYGLWLPQDTIVNNGDTVYKVSYGQGGETAVPYTVVKKGGRLKKHTRGLTSLSKIKNIPLNYWTPDGNFNVKWDGSDFFKFARQNPVTYMWEEMTDGDPDKGPMDISTLNSGDLNFWSQSLGGQVRIKLTGCIWNGELMKYTSCTYPDPDNLTQVVYFKEDIVFPGDTVPSPLTCYDNCPKYTEGDGGISGADPMYISDGLTSYYYSFAATADDMILRESANPLLWVGSASGQYQFGFMSGPLFDDTDPANISALDCNWDGDSDPATNAQMCGWKAHSELSEFYTWETGPNQWNQFTVLKDADGNVLEFQPPLQVQYTHTESGHKYEGVAFNLEYSGFGNLHGIPGTCIDMDTGQPVNCGPGTRWVPEFSIADGSEATDGTNDYLIKALRKEQRMSNVDIGDCSSLSISSYTLPLIDDWTDPAIGDEPVVENAPAVVGGVIQ